MSVSYNRVNWADYPATTTPVNATNLNKMDKGIADLTREVNSVESSVSNLNSSLSGIDIRLNTTSNQPEWSARGAGSWSPFSGAVKAFLANCYDGSIYHGSCYISNEDGTKYHQDKTLDDSAGVSSQWAQFMLQSELIRSITAFNASNGAITMTLDKDGYYVNSSGSNVPKYHDAGDSINFYVTGTLLYLGETNPFE